MERSSRNNYSTFTKTSTSYFHTLSPTGKLWRVNNPVAKSKGKVASPAKAKASSPQKVARRSLGGKVRVEERSGTSMMVARW